MVQFDHISRAVDLIEMCMQVMIPLFRPLNTKRNKLIKCLSVECKTTHADRCCCYRLSSYTMLTAAAAITTDADAGHHQCYSHDERLFTMRRRFVLLCFCSSELFIKNIQSICLVYNVCTVYVRMWVNVMFYLE